MPCRTVHRKDPTADDRAASGLLLAVGVLFFAAAATLVVAHAAEATHFRAGTMQWHRVSDVSSQVPPLPVPLPLPPVPSLPVQLPIVNLTVQAAFRGNYPTFPPFPQTVGASMGQGSTLGLGAIDWGDGTTSDFDAFVTSVDVLDNTVYVRFTEVGTANDLTHLYPSGLTTTYNAIWTSSARLSFAGGHVNNPDRTWYLTTNVDLTAFNHSPVATLVPVRPCPWSG
ncbi:MAG: hypothetical protein LC620_00635, partial [Halobacteriales archaeon]|nr:hypothetical protein [Halobacteriales archaeon]